MKIHIGLLAIFLTSACGGQEVAEPLTPAPFEGERAFEDLKFLVEEIGTRRIGTSGSQKTRKYIRNQLEPLGWIFEEDTFEAVPPEGARRKGRVKGVNLIAHWPEKKQRSVWICSHYDTFDKPKFVGANDSGSSTAVLIEIGRQISAKKLVSPEKGTSDLGITLCWFDGEEPFYPIPWDDQTNSTFGSRHLASKMQKNGTLKEIGCLLLLDMVGDKELGLYIESMSSGWIARIIENTATGLGYDQLIVGRKEIKDDHRPFIRKGVPGADLIDFHFGPANSHWHTDKDTLEACSKESLEITGTLVMTALPSLLEQTNNR